MMKLTLQKKRKQTKKASKIVAITRKKKPFAETVRTSKKKLTRLDSQVENNKIDENLLNNQESKFSRTLFGEMK